MEKAMHDVAPRISDVLSGHLRISFCVHQRHSTVRESHPAYPARTKSQTKMTTMTTIGRWNPQLFPYRLAWCFGDRLSTTDYFSCSSIPIKIVNIPFSSLFQTRKVCQQEVFRVVLSSFELTDVDCVCVCSTLLVRNLNSRHAI